MLLTNNYLPVKLTEVLTSSQEDAVLSYSKAFRFSHSFFVVYTSFVYLLFAVIAAVGGIFCISININPSATVYMLYVLAPFVAFTRLLITAKRQVYDQPSPDVCPTSFFIKQCLLCVPLLLAPIALTFFTRNFAFLLLIFPILLMISAYVHDFSFESVFHNMSLIIRRPGNFLLMLLFSMIIFALFFFAASSVEKLMQKFMAQSILMLLPVGLFPGINKILWGFVILIILRVIYAFVPKNGRPLFFMSFLLVIPSGIIYAIISSRFSIYPNLFIFLLMFQVYWYALLLISFLILLPLDFFAHLMAQVSHIACQQPLVQSQSAENSELQNETDQTTEQS